MKCLWFFTGIILLKFGKFLTQELYLFFILPIKNLEMYLVKRVSGANSSSGVFDTNIEGGIFLFIPPKFLIFWFCNTQCINVEKNILIALVGLLNTKAITLF